MSKNNSAKSKEIINFILNDGDFKNLSERQKKVIFGAIPGEIKGLSKDNLSKNSVISGSDNKKYKINYNKRSNWISFTGSQTQARTIFNDIKRKFDESKSSKENLLKWIREDLIEYIAYMLNLAQQDDEWIIFNKNIDSFERYSFEKFDFRFEKVESDIMTINKKNTWYITWQGKKLFQVQAPISKDRPNSHNFRINKIYINEFYKEVKSNNETWGISVEVALCRLNSIEIPSEYKNRFNDRMVLEAQRAISKHFSADGRTMPGLTECLATKIDGRKKSPTDFMAGNKKVSVKSNFNGNTKVCPPEIGQPGIIEGTEYYSKITGSSFSEENIFINNFHRFKKAFQENIDIIFSDQVRNLFSEDYIFYLRKLKSGNITIEYIPTSVKNYKFDISKFTFTKSYDQWNESVTIGYDGQKNVAEMQLHKNRSPFKFRFNLINLMKIIKKVQGN